MKAKIVKTEKLLEENEFLKNNNINRIEKFNDDLTIIFYEAKNINTIDVSNLTLKEKTQFFNLYPKLKFKS